MPVLVIGMAIVAVGFNLHRKKTLTSETTILTGSLST